MPDADKTRLIVRLQPGMVMTYCAKGHDLREVDLQRPNQDVRFVSGDCPSCERRYVSPMEPD